jgi:tetratricopeptide (TPR) repeat protein
MSRMFPERTRVARYGLVALVCVTSFCLVTSPARGAVAAAGARSLFGQANEAYNNNDFGTAAETYKKLLESGQECGEVLYNIGNCYYRMDKLGMALVYYERARRFMPRNRTLVDNIALTESRAMDRVVVPIFQTVARRLFFWHYRLTAREISLTVVASNVLFWVSLGILAAARKRFARVLVALAGAILILSGGSYAFKEVEHHSLGDAVVTAEEAQVRTGPGDYAVTFNLHDGARLKLVEARDGWYQVRLVDGKRGWIEADEVETI